MSENLGDKGFSINTLWGTAWVLGIVAFGSLLRLVDYAVDGARVEADLFVWLLVGAIASAFSAACVVLVAVKSVERRLSGRIDTARK